MGGKPVDIAIVGAGAAGLMTAIAAGRTARPHGAPCPILLLDGQPVIGAKILMSGGTRCNVTNQEVKPSDFQGGPRHFVKHVLEAFTPQATLRWFEEIGVKVVLEPNGKYFPTTHSAKTILEALVKETSRLGITLKKGIRITTVQKEGDLFHLKSSEGTGAILAKKVVLTTGGLSYPGTGSDGTGYRIAESFGHTILKTFPALTPLLTDDPDWKALSGVSLEAQLSFFKNGKKVCETRGPFLFTHFGFSGPAALDISRHWASAQKGEKPEIIANFLPEGDERSLPARFVETLHKKAGVERKRFEHLMFQYPLEITGVFGYKKAEVTAGGVDLKEINHATMESKLVKGLYFAGEILDVDGRIGGFNFQWAWSTGAVAGQSAARSVLL